MTTTDIDDRRSCKASVGTYRIDSIESIASKQHIDARSSPTCLFNARPLPVRPLLRDCYKLSFPEARALALAFVLDRHVVGLAALRPHRSMYVPASGRGHVVCSFLVGRAPHRDSGRRGRRRRHDGPLSSFEPRRPFDCPATKAGGRTRRRGGGRDVLKNDHAPGPTPSVGRSVRRAADGGQSERDAPIPGGSDSNSATTMARNGRCRTSSAHSCVRSRPGRYVSVQACRDAPLFVTPFET